MTAGNELLAVAALVARALDRCGVRYSVGGSLASAFSGEPRSTLDIDVLVDLPAALVDRLVSELGSEFHADADGLARAVHGLSSVNIFHAATSIKVDLFVAGTSPLERAQLDRRALIHIATGESFYIHSPEDILLQKLHWYQLGGEVSDRQWRDILGILVVQRGRLDLEFVKSLAARTGLDRLLQRALDESSS